MLWKKWPFYSFTVKYNYYKFIYNVSETCLNERQITPKRQWKNVQSREPRNTGYTRRRQSKQNNNTLPLILDLFMQFLFNKYLFSHINYSQNCGLFKPCFDVLARANFPTHNNVKNVHRNLELYRRTGTPFCKA